MNYIIEGTISEITKTNGKNSFKISGSEGYALKQKKGKDETKSNVLCLEETSESDNKKTRNAIIVPIDNSFEAKDDEVYLLSLALLNGKKCRISFSRKTKTSKDFKSDDYEITSLSVLSD